jgi:hypothetical protein
MRGNSLKLGKNGLARKVLPLLWVLFLVAGAAFFAGCGGDDTKDTGKLIGEWKLGDAVSYKITGTTVEYVGNYKATIENSPDFDAATGVLIIKFTEYTKFDYSNYPDVTTASDPTMVGKYSGLYWKDLDSDSVYLADAWKTEGTSVIHAIESEKTLALTTFAVGNYANFGLWGTGITPYSK